MILRLSVRFASAYRRLLTEESGLKFVGEVERRLASRKGLLSFANGTPEPSTSATETQLSYWQGIANSAASLKEKLHEIEQLNSFVSNSKDDKEMEALAKDDLASLDEAVDEACDELASRIRVETELDVLNKCQMEFTRFEAGVHRVQRIPLTDKSRMHTSTASVIVLPEPEEVSVIVPTDSVKIEAMRASGPGGQNVNKRSSAVRITHKETGISVHCMDERFQHLNLQVWVLALTSSQLAFKRLAAILMQQRADKIYDEISSSRKIQMGSRGRAEKIRTYNFQADRITDHRLHKSVGDVQGFMRGGEALEEMIDELQRAHDYDRVEDIVENLRLE